MVEALNAGGWRGIETDCMPDDTVQIGPVSASKFPVTGKLTGNFAESGSFRRFRYPVNEQIQSLAAKFPTQPSREFLETEQGILDKEQGILGNSKPGPNFWTIWTRLEANLKNIETLKALVAIACWSGRWAARNLEKT
jgi:hypothetical protein